MWFQRLYNIRVWIGNSFSILAEGSVIVRRIEGSRWAEHHLTPMPHSYSTLCVCLFYLSVKIKFIRTFKKIKRYCIIYKWMFNGFCIIYILYMYISQRKVLLISAWFLLVEKCVCVCVCVCAWVSQKCRPDHFACLASHAYTVASRQAYTYIDTGCDFNKQSCGFLFGGLLLRLSVGSARGFHPHNLYTTSSVGTSIETSEHSI